MSADPSFSASRRAFLKLSRQTREVSISPPRSDETTLAAHCTGCSDCVTACPEKIIVLGSDRRPLLDFDKGACTFCDVCAEACPTDAIDSTRELDWPWKAEVQNTCLSMNGVMCRTCEDVCEPRAIRFKLALGGKSAPLVDFAQCTGCGACAHSCPAQAIRINKSQDQTKKVTA
ncbi:ferredoxin-type protein NapF [Roseibium sediminicola]|uniref:ferredoxin-type protein NapF n=1 Tax=Roseibium sediminicola TaxID=2933272 RepID=UPI003CE46FF3